MGREPAVHQTAKWVSCLEWLYWETFQKKWVSIWVGMLPTSVTWIQLLMVKKVLPTVQGQGTRRWGALKTSLVLVWGRWEPTSSGFCSEDTQLLCEGEARMSWSLLKGYLQCQPSRDEVMNLEDMLLPQQWLQETPQTWGLEDTGSVMLRMRMAGAWAREPYLLCFSSRPQATFPGFLRMSSEKCRLITIVNHAPWVWSRYTWCT